MKTAMDRRGLKTLHHHRTWYFARDHFLIHQHGSSYTAEGSAKTMRWPERDTAEDRA